MQPDEMVGHVLGHYRIVQPLGYGGTATVFLAEDLNLQRQVAIKVFRPREGDVQDFLRRFAREARVLAKLDHPNILPVYDYGEQNNSAYIVMPYLAGGSLRDRLQKERVISIAESIHLISQVLKALQYAHDHGLIHRDIKPGNILFKSDGSPILSDFGLVKVMRIEGNLTPLEETMSVSGQMTISGTPEYMPPEQINGKVVAASDIYAVGILLYEMCTGQRPFSADNYLGILMKHLHQQPTPPRTLNPRISPELEQIIMRALEKEPQRRYARPADLEQALQEALAHAQASSTNRAITTSSASNVPPANPTPIPTIYEQVSYAATSAARHTPFASSPTEQTWGESPIPAAIKPRLNKFTATVLILILCIVLGSLGLLYYGIVVANPGQHPPATVIATQTLPAPGTTPNTTAVPASSLTTSCPNAGQARAAVMFITPPMTIRDSQNIIYVVNEFDDNKHPTFGTVKRHDTVTGESIEVNKTPNSTISEAQVSQDGQWVLFTIQVAGQSELRMVRIDGQGVQTLYCASGPLTISDAQWSFHEQFIVFNVGQQNGLPIIYLLDTTSGHIQQEMVPQSNLGFMPRTWLDRTHVYLTAFVPNSDAPPQDIYVLDIQKGANQHDTDLKKIPVSSNLCTSYDSNYDSTQLLISSCTPSTPATPGIAGTPGAPSTITTQPALGGTPKTFFPVSGSPALAIKTLRTISKTTLLLLVENYSGDTTNDGLWKLNADGTGLTRLSTDTNHAQSLCQFTQYTWSNVSPDGNMFALQYYDQKSNDYRLYFGSMQTGQLTQFADISDGTQLFLAGWTKM